MHKLIIWLSLSLNLSLSCNLPDSSSNESRKTSEDSIQVIKQAVIDAFRTDEGKAMDSLNKYGLSIVYDSCLKYLYTIYGSESVKSSNLPDSTTIGESNIKLITFKDKSKQIKQLVYGVFISDSIPTDFILKTSLGHMITSFDVDVYSKQLIEATQGEAVRIKVNDIERLSDSALKSEDLKKYVKDHQASIHPKFKKILQSVNYGF